MIYFDPAQNQFHFYRIEATFTHNGEERHNFHNSKEYFIDFAGKHSGIDNLTIKSVQPTDQQKNRLNELNALSGVQGHFSDARAFVEYGIVNPEGPLNSLYNDYESSTLNFIKENINSEIRKIRKQKEEEGVSFEYNGQTLFVRSDSETQAKIASAKQALSDNTNMDYIDWERRPNEWSEVNIDMLTVMGNAVFEHVQSVFTESKNQMNKVNNCTTFDDFKTMSLNWITPQEVFPLGEWIEESV